MGAGWQTALANGEWTGDGWYDRQFSHCPLGIPTGEASPNYCFYFDSIRRIRAASNKVKLILILRDPVDRAVSHYHWEVRMGNETRPIMEAMQAGVDMRDYGQYGHAYDHYSYLLRGQYADQIDNILRYFYPESLLICKFSELVLSPKDFMNRVTDFIDAPRWNGYDFSLKMLENNYPAPSQDVVEFLVDYFELDQQRLQDEYDLDLRDGKWRNA